jgi:hypothetical protein
LISKTESGIPAPDGAGILKNGAIIRPGLSYFFIAKPPGKIDDIIRIRAR